MMTKYQCAIAGEGAAMCALAQAGYDVLVQPRAGLPIFDQVARKGPRTLDISVKASQDGGWVLSVRNKGETPLSAIDRWYERQAGAGNADLCNRNLVFILVQFLNVNPGHGPRIYVARPSEIAAHLRALRGGQGSSSLPERLGNKVGAIPQTWVFSQHRIDTI